MRHLPVLSGQEFADALRRAGFDAQTQFGRHVRMVSETHVVVVPLMAELSDDLLRHLLLAANLTPSRLLELVLAGGPSAAILPRATSNATVRRGARAASRH